MIKLCRANLQHITTIKKPDDKIFLLPEKVLQFGTGVLLRGLPDYFIDKANRQNIFNGRIVVVKSTTKNNIDNFETQDGLYTLCMRGLKNNVVQSVNYLCASISRVIDANKNWNNVLACAENPSIEIIISNTTEVGFALNEQDKIFTNSAPLSFPAKLLAFLYRRYTFFKGDATMGIVIIPTELISENGTVLKNICLDLAHIHQLGNSFIQWIETANEFCDSLVDRIVPGKPDKEFKNELSQSLGYEDDLMIMSESYVLWAIQARSPLSQKKLSFHLTDDGAIVTNNIEKYKTLKLYLLNATHTFSCILAIAGGFKYVNEALDNGEFEQYIKDLLLSESAPSLTNETISFEEAENFAIEVIHRFKNPFIKHKWSDIARQMTIKIRLRCVPLILLYHAKFHRIPSLMIKGFSAFLFFMRSYKYGEDDFIAVLKNNNYCIEDQNAKLLHEYWLNKNTDEGVGAIIADKDLWGTDLGLIDGFKDAVINEIILFGNERK